MAETIRQMIVTKFVERHEIGKQMVGRIIPDIIKHLNAQSNLIKNHDVLRMSHELAEVKVVIKGGMVVQHAVNLNTKTCSCRAWQICGRPCTHALAFIQYIRQADMNDYVHEYFSVEKKFKNAYAGVFNPMVGKEQWKFVDLGYKIRNPKLRRKPGRPRVARIKEYEEPGARKRKVRCSECNELGHFAKTCEGGPIAKERKMASSSSQGSAVKSNEASISHVPATNSNSATSLRHLLFGGRPPISRGRGRRGGGVRGRGASDRATEEC